MMIERVVNVEYRLLCDKRNDAGFEENCEIDYSYPDIGQNIEFLIKKARDAGWIVDHLGHSICPNCQAKMRLDEAKVSG